MEVNGQDLADGNLREVRAVMKIAVICMGNICRSPMGEYIIRGLAAERGAELEVCSGGTGDWHIGESAHEKSVKALAELGYDASGHRARQFSAKWFDQHDLILVMDKQNERAVLAQARNNSDRAKVQLFRSYDDSAGPSAEVADPYGFPLESYRQVRDQIVSAANGLLSTIVDGVQ